MSVFLYGRTLSRKVDELLSENCTCIVSYIGKGTTDKISKNNKKKKVNIICNFHSNGTNPYEVEKLIGYLGPEKVKQMDKFHSKVYFSESGAVICSANLSTNGLELFNEPANQLEAGIFVKNNELAYKEVLKWHKSLSGKLKKIEQQEIKKRQESYKPTGHHIGKRRSRIGREVTIKEFLNNPNQFGLFFCSEDNTVNEKKDKIKDAAINQTIEKYMKEQKLDFWTYEPAYKPSTVKFNKALKIIEERTLLDISAEEDEDELLSPNTLKIQNTLLKYNRHHTVYVKKINKNKLVLFYKKNNEYKITNDFKSELKTKLRKSLNDEKKRKEWQKWLRSDEGSGWFMSIDTLKKLI